MLVDACLHGKTINNSKKMISMQFKRMIFGEKTETVIIRRDPRGTSGVLARFYLLT